MRHPFPILTPEEAAAMINDRQTVGFSGFTAAGATKAIPGAIAARATAEHTAGRPFKIGVITGASTGPSLDGALARADAVLFRTPYQSDPDLRKLINSGKTRFFDMHLSTLPGAVRACVFGPMHWAVVEACDVLASGEIVLTASVGATPTFCHRAEKILIELNRAHPPELRGLHDIYEPADPPFRREIPIYSTADRIGAPFIKVDPSRIVGIVETNKPDESVDFALPNDVTTKIGNNVAEFLASQKRSGHIPAGFLPIQSGVGDIANAMLGAMGSHPEIPPFEMYSEVLQDSAMRLVQDGRIRFASGVSLSLGAAKLKEVYGDLTALKRRLVLRPQEITNSPEIIRRLALITINTALEVDIFGNVNSTHVLGRSMMNGIGGSGDFTRNAYISIFTCPSTAKNGTISTIVPLVSHVDHSEHSVQVVVTEHGYADLRGLDPHQRARLIIANCAHPDFREDLLHYYGLSSEGHIPLTLKNVFGMHIKYLETGSMRGVDWKS